jgi:hypothetical protein
MITRRRMIAGCLAAAVAGLGPARADRPIRLVLVHGRGQEGLDPAALRADWMSALAEGGRSIGKTLPSVLDIAFPFYGDVLGNFVKQADLPLTKDVIARGGQPNDDFLAFEADVAESLRKQTGVSDQDVLSEYGANPKPRGPLNWEWVHAIFRAIDTHVGGLSADAIENVLRDVYLYSTVKVVRDAVDAVVRASIDERPTVVVAHSLGTVVAYNVLRQDDRALKVPLLTTVGSPLAIRAIRDQLLPLSYPAPVSSWYNAYDPRDVVALYPLNEDNFPLSPPIENYAGVENKTSDRHRISGYLNDPQVAGRVLAALGA